MMVVPPLQGLGRPAPRSGAPTSARTPAGWPGSCTPSWPEAGHGRCACSHRQRRGLYGKRTPGGNARTGVVRQRTQHRGHEVAQAADSGRARIYIGLPPACLPPDVQYDMIYLSTVDYGIPPANSPTCWRNCAPNWRPAANWSACPPRCWKRIPLSAASSMPSRSSSEASCIIWASVASSSGAGGAPATSTASFSSRRVSAMWRTAGWKTVLKPTGSGDSSGRSVDRRGHVQLENARLLPTVLKRFCFIVARPARHVTLSRFPVTCMAPDRR